MPRFVALALVATVSVGCGAEASEAPTAPAPPSAPASAAPVVPPPASPARFIPANGQVLIASGEDRGIVGTDVVVRVDPLVFAPETHACTVHVVLHAGVDVRDETGPCEAPLVFHDLTITVEGATPMVGRDLVGLTIASNGPAAAPEADCATDADCVLAAYSCCSAPACDESGYNADVLAFLQDRCAHRVCPPHEPRPCGEPPVAPTSMHAACVSGLCQAATR